MQDIEAEDILAEIEPAVKLMVKREIDEYRPALLAEIEPAVKEMMLYWRKQHLKRGRDTAMRLFGNTAHFREVASEVVDAIMRAGGGSTVDPALVFVAIEYALTFEAACRTKDYRKPTRPPEGTDVPDNVVELFKKVA